MGAAPKIVVNKRAADRHPVAVKAKVRSIGNKEWTESAMINLSKTGTCIETPLGFFIGQMIEIMVEKEKGQKPHLIMATVVWKRANKHGVNFL
jgi:hypothetical protein